jgi:Tfp pilus assembly PilM family ATPase
MARIKQIVGLDLGARNVRAVWMEAPGGVPRAMRVETLALPPEAQDAPDLLRAWLERHGLSRGFAAVALPGGSAVFQPGRIPHSDPRTPQQAAAMDLVQFSEMAGDTMRYDVHAFEVPAEPGHTFYLLAMARPMAIERALQAAAQAGVRPADLVPAPVALYNALEPLAGPHTQPWLYLDVGHQQTDVAVGLPTGLLFARSVPVGGRSFTDAVAQSGGLNPVQAETRKHADAGLLDGQAFQAPLRAAADRWLTQISSCLSVYRTQYGGGTFAIGQIVLTGGGAQLRGLAAHTGLHFRLPAIHAADLPAATAAARAWLGGADLAAGLAATAIEAAAARVSLLPAKLRDEIVFRQKKPFWIAAAVFGALALGVFTVNGVVSLKNERQRIEKERGDLQRRAKLVKLREDYGARCRQVRARGAPLLQLLGVQADGGLVVRDVLTLVANSLHPNDWITLFCDEASYVPPAADAAAAKPPARPALALFRDLRTDVVPAAKAPPAPAPLAALRPVFIVEGYTPDPSLATVKEMLARLRTAAQFRRVDLLADDRVLPPKDLTPEERDALPPYRRFVIQLEVKAP